MPPRPRPKRLVDADASWEAYRARLEKSLNPNPNVSARGNDDAEAVKQLVYAVQAAALLELLFEKTASFEVLPFKGTAATWTA